MELPLLIERLPNNAGYAARLGEPFNLTAIAQTAGDAHQQVLELLKRRMNQGAELRSIVIPSNSGDVWLPDDDVTREWLECVQQYRDECDAADRQRLLGQPADEKAAS